MNWIELNRSLHTFYNPAQDSVKFYKNFIIFTHWCGLFCNGCSRASTFPVLFSSELFNNNLVQEGVRKGLGWCSFAKMFILSCGIAIFQNQVVCGILKFSGNFNGVCGFLMSFCRDCVLFMRISTVQFCSVPTPLQPSGSRKLFNNFFLVKLREYRNYYCTSKVSPIVILLAICCPLYL